jgi:(p)ppGpp synthase/HD superfamily hydrolase
MFGQQIADLVAELTSSKDEIKHRYDGSKTNYLIYKMSNMSEDALLIKLADRFKNIEDAFTASEKFRNKYYTETKEIIEELEKARHLDGIHRLLANDIKAKLDNISSMFNI